MGEKNDRRESDRSTTQGIDLQENDPLELLFKSSSTIEIDNLKNALNRISRQKTEVKNDLDVKNNPNDLAEVTTIEKMSANIKQIFFKIVEQINDPQHPLAQICKAFQIQFMKDIDYQA